MLLKLLLILFKNNCFLRNISNLYFLQGYCLFQSIHLIFFICILVLELLNLFFKLYIFLPKYYYFIEIIMLRFLYSINLLMSKRDIMIIKIKLMYLMEMLLLMPIRILNLYIYLHRICFIDDIYLYHLLLICQSYLTSFIVFTDLYDSICWLIHLDWSHLWIIFLDVDLCIWYFQWLDLILLLVNCCLLLLYLLHKLLIFIFILFRYLFFDLS